MQMKVSDEMNFETRVELYMLKELTVREFPKTISFVLGQKTVPFCGTVNRPFRICRIKCDGFSDRCQ